jgi:hypothetical protein
MSGLRRNRNLFSRATPETETGSLRATIGFGVTGYRRHSASQ